MGNFWAGLDLGQAADYTALIIAEQTLAKEGRRYDVRHIQRFPLGTPYPRVVETVCTMLARPPLADSTSLVIDGTGVGRAPVDLFRNRLGLIALPVTITASGTAHEAEDGYWHVPKRDLVGVVQVLLQTHHLHFAERLPEAHTLVQELLSFQVKITESANDTYGVWREGAHDDLVLAMALAVWRAEQPVNLINSAAFMPRLLGAQRRR